MLTFGPLGLTLCSTLSNEQVSFGSSNNQGGKTPPINQNMQGWPQTVQCSYHPYFNPSPSSSDTNRNTVSQGLLVCNKGHIQLCDSCLLGSIAIRSEEKEPECGENSAKLVMNSPPLGNSKDTALSIPQPLVTKCRRCYNTNSRRNYDEASVSLFMASNTPAMQTLASTSINLPDIAAQTICSHTRNALCQCPFDQISVQLSSEFPFDFFNKNPTYTCGNSGAGNHSVITSRGCSGSSNCCPGECVTSTSWCHRSNDRHTNSSSVLEERPFGYEPIMGLLGGMSCPEYSINSDSCIQSRGRGLATTRAPITMEQLDTPVTNIVGLSHVFPAPDTFEDHFLDWDSSAFNLLSCDQGVTSATASSIEQHEFTRNLPETPLETRSDISLTPGDIETMPHSYKDIDTRASMSPCSCYLDIGSDNREAATDNDDDDEEEAVLRLITIGSSGIDGPVTSTMA